MLVSILLVGITGRDFIIIDQNNLRKEKNLNCL